MTNNNTKTNGTSKFEKVSLEQFKEDWVKIFPEDKQNNKYIENIYNNIKLPKRATSKSAGYDFFIPMDAIFSIGGDMIIPTGIRCTNMPVREVLMIYPRSGLGSKYRFILANLTAIIDADYADSDNEGHIFIKMVNDGDEEIILDSGKAFCQGILLPYDVTIDDDNNKLRNGGFGSTD